MKYSNLIYYSFFDKYGLADLIYNYCRDNSIRDYIHYIENDFSEDELCDYYHNVYRSHLRGEMFLALPNTEAQIFGYSSIDNFEEGKPNTKRGQYMSPHVISSDKSHRANLIKIMDSEQITDLKSSGAINPFSTSMKSNTKPISFEFSDILHKISSIVGVMTRNKFSYYGDNGYYSFIPEYKDFMDYIKHISYMYVFNNIITQERGLYQRGGDRITRPKIEWEGNFGIKILRDRGLEPHHKQTIAELNLLFSFYSKKDDIEISKKLEPAKWYGVCVDKINKIELPSTLIEEIKTKTLSEISIDYNHFNHNRYKINKKDDKGKWNSLFFTFIMNPTMRNMDRILLYNPVFNENNLFINYFIKTKMNTLTEDSKNIVQEFTQKLGTTLYYKAKEYEEVKRGNPSPDVISERKAKLIFEIKSLLNRSNKVEDFLSTLTDFFDKHKIYRSFDFESIINANFDNYEDFKNIVKIYLYQKNKSNKEEQVVETQEEI